MLKELLDQIKELTAESNIEPEAVAPSVRAGTEAIKRNAIRNLAEKKAEYLQLVPNHFGVIAVTGDSGEEFAREATNIGYLALNYEEVNKRLAKAINARSAKGEFYSPEYWAMIEELTNIKSDLKAQSLPVPNFKTDEAGRFASIDDAVKTLIERELGTELYALYTRKLAAEKALELKFHGDLIPIIVYNYKEGNGWALPSPIGLITANETTTDQVKEVLEQVKTKILSGKKNSAKKTKKTMETLGE